MLDFVYMQVNSQIQCLNSEPTYVNKLFSKINQFVLVIATNSVWLSNMTRKLDLSIWLPRNISLDLLVDCVLCPLYQRFLEK